MGGGALIGKRALNIGRRALTRIITASSPNIN